ncbi:hypothetical protein C0991_011082 [Blastosporella zonata]|nr:hypothetical protein C0991_011082 [Blastosporella zonata]
MPSTTDPPYSTRFSPRGDPDANASSTGGFAPGASPPLIFAFVAIGFFFFSMGMFRWRRIRFARFRIRGMNGTGEHQWEPEQSHTRYKSFGRRPVLWDLQTIDEKGYHDGGGSLKNFDQQEDHETWDAIMPVSVVVVSPPPPPNGGETVVQSPDARYSYWSPIATTTASCSKGKDHAFASANSSAINDEKRLQVAVTIAMPSQRIPHDATEARHDHTFEYTLGVYECPWRRDMRSGECRGVDNEN